MGYQVWFLDCWKNGPQRTDYIGANGDTSHIFNIYKLPVAADKRQLEINTPAARPEIR
jgi:hypothetical protein